MKKIMVMFLLICSWNMVAMYLPQSIRSNKQLQELTKQRMEHIKQQRQQKSMQKAVARLEQEDKIPENEVLIRGKGMAEGALINKDIAAQNSGFVKAYLEDWSDKDARPVFDLGISVNKEAIESFFAVSDHIATMKKNEPDKVVNFNKFKSGQLVPAADINELIEGPKGNTEIIVSEIKKRIKEYNQIILDNALDNIIRPELKEQLIKAPCINMVDSLVMQRLSSKETMHTGSTINSIACQPGGSLIAYSCKESESFFERMILSNLYLVGDGNVGEAGGIGNKAIKDISSVAFSSDGKYLVAAGGLSWKNSNMFVFDVATRSLVHNYDIPGHISQVKCIANTNRFICRYSHRDENFYCIIDILTGKVENLPQFDSLCKGSFDCSIDGKYVVIPMNNSKGFVIWNIDKFNTTLNTDHITKTEIANTPFDEIYRIAISPDNKLVAVAGEKQRSYRLMLADISDINNITFQNIDRGGYIRALVFDRLGRSILVGYRSWNDNIELFDISDKNNIQSTVSADISKYITAIAFDQLNSNRIIVGGECTKGIKQTLIDWTLCTNEQRQAIDAIKKLSNPDLLFIYRLCVRSLQREKVDLGQNRREYAQFMILPSNVQQLLKDLSLVTSGVSVKESISQEDDTNQVNQNGSWLWQMARKYIYGQK